MKRLFYCAAALATLLFAGSCQRENLEPVQENMPVTFTVEAPAAVQTKAEIGDGLNVNELIYEVWLTDELGELTTEDQKLYQGTTPMQVDPADNKNKATLTLDLMNDQKFTILFWAQVQGTGVYNTTELNAVTYTKADLNGAYAANDERLAAFYAVAYVNDCQHVTKECIATGSQVTLYRPFAQLNLGTENTSTAYDVELSKSTMKITNVNTVFNVATSVASEPKVMTFVMNAVPSNPDVLTVNGKEYEYAGMNYLFAGNNAKVEYNIETLVGNEKTVATVNHTVDQVPLKENFRTNIIGNLLTNNVQYEIVVDADFNVPDIVLGEEWSQTGSYQYAVYPDAGETSLKDILVHADSAARKGAVKSEGPVVTINLAGDVYWETGGGHGSTPLLPEDSPISAVVINGNGQTFTATGAGVGPIRLANGGKLTFNDVNVVDKSVSYAENSWEFTYLEFAGHLAFSGCTFNSGVQFETENDDVVLDATFDDCHFISNETSVYAAWICDGKAKFTGCSFEGTRGPKIHEAYGSEVESVSFEKCVFGPLSEKPGVVIGTLNAETTVSITDSYFFGCQPGDQEMTIYESDTDVTTFTFDIENNEVHNTPSAMVNDWVTNAQSGDVVDIPAGEYAFPATESFNGKENVTLNCAEGTVFTGASSLNINGATVIGATFSNPSGNAVSGTINGTIKDCVFEGSNGLRYCYAGETVVFENCVFSGSTYGAHFDGGSNDIIFKNCTFSGFNAFGSAVTLVTFDECTFKSNGKSGYNVANLWGSTKMINTEFTFDGSAATEWVDCITTGKTYEFTGCTINGGTAINPDYIWSRNAGTKIVFDGVEYVFAEGDYYVSASEAIVTNATALTAAIEAAHTNIILMPGTYEGTFALKADGTTIDGRDEAVVHCINLNGKENVTLRDITFDAAGAKACVDRKASRYNGNIITGDADNNSSIGARNLLVDGCTFTGTFADGGVAIAFADRARPTGATGDVTIKNCIFETTGAYYDIWGYYTGVKDMNFVIEENTFKSSITTQGMPISFRKLKTNEPVVIKGNTFENVNSIEDAAYVEGDSGYTTYIEDTDNKYAE